MSLPTAIVLSTLIVCVSAFLTTALIVGSRKK